MGILNIFNNLGVTLNGLVDQYVKVDYDSTVDQAETIQSAIDAATVGDVLYFSAGVTTGVVKVETQINVNKRLTILGDNKVTFQTTSDIFIFNVTASYCEIGKIRFLGDASAGGLGGKSDQVGIRPIGVDGFYFHDIVANNMNGGLVEAQTISSTNHDGNIISNCFGYNCQNTYYMNSGAEYITLSNCHSTSHQRGMWLKSGNIQVIGGNCSEGVRGLYMSGTGNSGHGLVSGFQSKHNTTSNLEVAEVSTGLGMAFSGCSFWSGDISVTNADGVNFTGCGISTTSLTIDGCAVIFTGNFMHTSVAETILNSGVLHKSNNFVYTSAKVLTAW